MCSALQQCLLPVATAALQEPGIADALRIGSQFSLYLPASSLSGIKAQVVAERVEAVLLGAAPLAPGERLALLLLLLLLHKCNFNDRFAGLGLEGIFLA
jgi:hypothetical protein